MRVIIMSGARRDFQALPAYAKSRVTDVFARLAEWPNVSGVKALRGNRAGEYRIRTGDYRVIFVIVLPDEIRVVKIGNRRDVYED